MHNQALINIKNNRMQLLAPCNSNINLTRPHTNNKYKSGESESEFSYELPIESK